MLSCASAEVLYETLAFRECIYLIYEKRMSYGVSYNTIEENISSPVTSKCFEK